ncbi:MAG TPA: hypothetical protein VE130_02835 [Nitrososphaeraceae archaeon]|nr:hypothetical protein [Nitrososphaeraceae archaeon]
MVSRIHEEESLGGDIRDIILSSGENEVTVDQIKVQLSKQLVTAISRQQVHSYLKEPWAKSLLHKEKNRYFMKHIVTYDDWSVFSTFINELQYFSNFKELWQNREFRSNFQKNSLENILFQFSNQVGALLSYIIIEALRPTETLKLVKKRKKIATQFVREAISPEYLLQTFLNNLPFGFREKYGIGPWHIVTDEEGKKKKAMIKNSNIGPEINQLYINENQDPLKDLIDAYNRVYPHLHDLLEKEYQKYVDRNQEWTQCDHLWETVNIHKIGVGYKCHNCFKTIEEKAFERNFLN